MADLKVVSSMWCAWGFRSRQKLLVGDNFQLFVFAAYYFNLASTFGGHKA
jgi:hypothetical protein